MDDGYRHAENLCEVAASCESHPGGGGCVVKHFPNGVARCPDRLRILGQNATEEPAEEESATPV